ncbi:isoprenyl transferase [Ectobacillus ponti]|uniref:Isoprenyl transferase n=1 Tax=Ectobacillus ponti TaxID=2961894 RepID=A0AA42BQ45_9BACI|nr:isoprenyl transferase [Ectobacillus ponti]MCP8969026.1 isoprenyl transferase [Ectobacillus ponti]
MMLKRFSFLKDKANASFQDLVAEAKQREIPEHIAIIMDGNGRWAKRRALPRVAGHHEGMKVVRKITKFASELGVKVLTLYAFSTENWKRPKPEVEYLMKLPQEFLGTFLPELVSENVQVRLMGHKEGLPAHTLAAVERAMAETAHNTGMVLNFALNYGSRDEMVYAVKNLVTDSIEGKFTAEDVTEQLLSSYLMTSSLPVQDPDLLIRTSGEIRISNFMLWQIAYTELWFTEDYWPDFTEAHLLEAVMSFQKRGRRFGGV